MKGYRDSGEGLMGLYRLMGEGIPTAQNANGFTSLEFRGLTMTPFSIKSATTLFFVKSITAIFFVTALISL